MIDHELRHDWPNQGRQEHRNARTGIRLATVVVFLASALQASTISVTSDPFSLGTLLTGYFTASINSDTGLLSGQFFATGGTLASSFSPSASITAQLSGLPSMTDILAAPPLQHLMFGYGGLDIEAGPGNSALLGPGSSHAVMGYAFNRDGHSYLGFWQDQALVTTPSLRLSVATLDSVALIDLTGPGPGPGPGPGGSVPEPVMWPVLIAVVLIGLVWRLKRNTGHA